VARPAGPLPGDFRPHTVVLDITLPDIDGLEVVRRIHAHTPETTILFLNGNGAVADRIFGLTAGGDDYVTKPFSIEEVAVRVGMLLDRATRRAGTASSRLLVGDLTLTNIVELYVSCLRRKDNAGWPPMIHTIRRAGYAPRPPAEY
jgi:two-component system OmpR family response regulator